MPRGVFEWIDENDLPAIFEWANQHSDSSTLADAYLAACHLIYALGVNNEIDDEFWRAAYMLRDRLGKKIIKNHLAPNAKAQATGAAVCARSPAATGCAADGNYDEGEGDE